MKNHAYEERPTKVLKSITCDVCTKTYDNDTMEGQMEAQEFWSFADTGGYGNMAFGDMNRIELDMCQYCAKRLLGPYIRVTPSEI